MTHVFLTRNIHLVTAFPHAEMHLSFGIDLPPHGPGSTWTDLNLHRHTTVTCVRTPVGVAGPDPAIVILATDPLRSPTGVTLKANAVGESFAFVTDTFAPGQFTQMSIDDRLAAPSFETLRSGVTIGAGATTRGDTVTTSMDTETIMIDPYSPPDSPTRGVLDASLVLSLAATSSRAQVRPTPRSGPLLSPLRFTLATLDELAVDDSTRAVGGTATTFSALRAAARAVGAPLQVVPVAEVKAPA